MKFTDIKLEDYSNGSLYKYVIYLNQSLNHDVEARIELIMEEDEYYLEVRSYILPSNLDFGERQPEIAFRNFDLDDLDLYRAEDGKDNKLMDLLENIRKALSFLTFGDPDAFEFPLK